MSLADIPLRAQTLSGQIKQADADIIECTTLRERAVKALDLAERNLASANDRAVELRKARSEMQREATELIALVGEPEIREEVIPSSPGLTVPNCAHEAVDFDMPNDRWQCAACGDEVVPLGAQARRAGLAR